MRAMLYKVACAAGVVLICSLFVMLFLVIDVSINANADEYFQIWFWVVAACVVLIVPEMFNSWSN